MTITATSQDGTVRTVSDMVANRFWTRTEFGAAVALANALNASPRVPGTGGLELVASYGDFDETTEPRRAHCLADDPRPPQADGATSCPLHAIVSGPRCTAASGYSTGISLLMRDRSMPWRRRTARATT